MTDHRFSRPRPVAVMAWLKLLKDLRVKPPETIAVTGNRTPKKISVSLTFALGRLAQDDRALGVSQLQHHRFI